MNPYTLSTDYDALFDRIINGETIVAFVDYISRGYGHQPPRDVCRVMRLSPFDIKISARGTMYGGVYPFQTEDDDTPERELFIQQCKALQLRWITP